MNPISISAGSQGCGFFFHQFPCGDRRVGNNNNIGFGVQRLVTSSSSAARISSDRINTLQEKEALDKYLTSSIQALSVQDRTTALEEVHGAVPSTAEYEDDGMLTQRLEEMEFHLTNSKTEGSAYETALNQNREYVQNRNLRLMFLRSNRYDGKQAAGQILKFFYLKKTLFGAEKLAKDILFQDLNPDDKKSLQAGSIQLLPAKDSIGRTILLFLPSLRSQDVPVESEARARFYLMMKTIASSEEVQRKGIIAVIYAVQEYAADKKKGAGAQLFARVATSLPVPYAGIHLCSGYDDYIAYVIMRAIITLLPAYLAPKFRVHLGSHVEVRYALRGFGIPDGFLPVSSSENINDSLLQDHKVWILQSAYEDNLVHSATLQTSIHPLRRPKSPSNKTNASPAVLMVGRPGETLSLAHRVTPLATDILLGHGFKLNPGNLKLHDMIGDIVDHYDAAERKGDKMSISCKLVEDCKASGSRFLSFDSTTRTWSIVCDKVARNKVAKAIRNRRRSIEGKVLLSRQSGM